MSRHKGRSRGAFAAVADTLGEAVVSLRVAFFPPGPSSGRIMTEAEIAFAREYFGDEIDYSKVRIHSVHMHRTAFCAGNHLYFSKALGDGSDYTKFEDVTHETQLRALLVHELTHVWQEQKHPGAWGKLKAGFARAVGRDPYAYDVTDKRSFLKYGIEQQAQLMQDFCRVREFKRLANEGDMLVRMVGLDEHEHYPAMEKKILPVFPVAPL